VSKLSTAKRINSTGRKKIRIDWITASIDDTEPAPRISFHVDLTALDLPNDAVVIAEAARGTLVERIALGTVSAVTPVDNYPLETFPTREGVRVAVKVADDSGRLCARSVAIKPDRAEGSDDANEPLLNFRADDSLGQVAWMLDFSTDEPVVVMNAALPGWNDVARSGIFVGLVYPEILRQISLWVVKEQDHAEEGSPCLQWKSFLTHIGTSPDGIGEGEVDEWAQGVALRFAEIHRLRDLTSESLGGGGS
jgi:hypothetical protein